MPGPHASSSERIAKLSRNDEKIRRGTCRVFLLCHRVVKDGRPVAIISNRADGQILEAPRGSGGFGYDPIFYFPVVGKNFCGTHTAREKPLKPSRQGFSPGAPAPTAIAAAIMVLWSSPRFPVCYSGASCVKLNRPRKRAAKKAAIRLPKGGQSPWKSRRIGTKNACWAPTREDCRDSARTG